MRRCLALAALMALLAPAAAWSQTCTVSASGLSLGIYTGAVLTTGTGSVAVDCPAATGYQVGLNAGTGAAASTTTRQMTGPGAATLNYQMFQDAARSVNWGNLTGTDTVAGTGSGVAQTINIFPRVAAGQNVAPGTYTDTIIASVTGLNNPTASFAVTATIVPSCTLSATPLNFGVYAGVTLEATTTVTVTCTNTTAWNLGLSAGNFAGATVSSRMMTGPSGASLAYGLFLTSAYVSNWGVTIGTDTATGTGTGINQPVTVYGRIGAGQFVRPGSYSDTIIATVTY